MNEFLRAGHTLPSRLLHKRHPTLMSSRFPPGNVRAKSDHMFLLFCYCKKKTLSRSNFKVSLSTKRAYKAGYIISPCFACGYCKNGYSTQTSSSFHRKRPCRSLFFFLLLATAVPLFLREKNDHPTIYSKLLDAPPLVCLGC